MAITSAFQADDRGSIPLTRSSFRGISSEVERQAVNLHVTGSTPVFPAKFEGEFMKINKILDDFTCRHCGFPLFCKGERCTKCGWPNT